MTDEPIATTPAPIVATPQPSTFDRMVPAPDAPPLTPAERAELAKIVADTPKGKDVTGAMREFWAARNTSGGSDLRAPEGAKPADAAAPEADATLRNEDGSIRMPDGPETPEAFDARLAALSDGVLDSGQLEVLGRVSEPFNRKLEFIAQQQGEDARAQAIMAGEARVVADVYAGDPAKMAAGVAEISEAVFRVGGSRAIEQINASGALSDPEVHRRALVLARSILAAKK